MTSMINELSFVQSVKSNQGIRWSELYVALLYDHFKRNPCLSGSSGSINI